VGKEKMKSFKGYLNEFVIQSTSDYVFDTMSNSISDIKIPISGPMFKRIWPDTIRATVFHSTDTEHLAGLKKLEGKKKSISAFFSMMSTQMEGGIATDGGVVVEMEADVLISAKDDIMSAVDKGGRRWVEMSWFENAQGRGNPVGFDKVEQGFNTLIKNLVKKHLPSDHFANPHLLAPLEVWSDMKRQLKAGTPAGAKKISLVIKDYFDGVEKVIKKNKKVFETIFYGYAKSKRQTDNAWDEQIVNNIKIKKVHILSDEVDLDHLHDMYPKGLVHEFPDVKFWDYSSELEIYTREVVKKEIGR
jgi:hypothetical protein